MIKILLSRITEKGLNIEGEEPSSFLNIKKDFFINFLTPIKYQLTLLCVNNDILLKGIIKTKIICTCGMCLKLYTLKIINNEVSHFYSELKKKDLDLTEDLREDILIVFPFKFKCSLDCKGICQYCGENLNKKRCSCKKSPKNINLAWSDLNKLKF